MAQGTVNKGLFPTPNELPVRGEQYLSYSTPQWIHSNYKRTHQK